MYAYAISAAFFSSCSLNPNLRGGGLYCGWIFFFSSYFFACVYECTSAHPMSFKTLAVFLLLLLMWWGWYGWMWWDDGVVWYFGWDNVLFLEFFLLVCWLMREQIEKDENKVILLLNVVNMYGGDGTLLYPVSMSSNLTWNIIRVLLYL